MMTYSKKFVRDDYSRRQWNETTKSTPTQNQI
jgi:hypothetical protein